MLLLRISGVKLVTFLVAFTLILLASSLPQAFATITLAYDNGNWDGVGGSAYQFSGVLFSLPSGVTSAKLRFIRWSQNGSPSLASTLLIYVTQADHVTELSGSPISVSAWGSPTTGCPPGPYPVGWGGCYGVDVTSYNFIVTGNFFVIYQTPTTGASSSLEADTGPSSGHSWAGSTLASMTPFSCPSCSSAFANFLIRVDIDPISTIIPEYPIGLPLLAIFMVIAYGLIRRKTIVK